MRHSNIFLLTLFIAIALLSSCSESFLDETLKSKYTPDNALGDSLGFEAAIAGLQSLVRGQYTSATVPPPGGTPVQGLISTMYVGTDMAIIGLVQNAEGPFERYTDLNSQNLAVSYYWTWAYSVINNANTIISRVQDPAIHMTQNNRNAISAEAKFFRAYAYNFLVTLYGEVPMVVEPISVPRTDYTRASVDDLNDLLIEDLTFAVTNLASVNNLKQPGRINKAAAQQLLAEVYLRIGTVENAALAEQLCLDIIGSGNFQLVLSRYGVRAGSPGDFFSDMFIYGNQRRSQGNTEAIWVIEQQYNLTGGSTYLEDQHRRVWVPFYANVTGMKIADSLGGRGIGRMRLSNWVINDLYEDGDMRNSKYNLKREFYYNDPNYVDYQQLVVPNDADTLSKIAPYSTKWNFYVSTDEVGFSSYKDLIMMRLGETYLLLAEAQFMQSNFDDAADNINVLRNRVGATPVDPGDVTLDLILDERARELLAEENRRMTLVRTGTLVDRVTTLNPGPYPGSGSGTTGVTSDNLLLPIPQSEIDLNKDAELGQNDGY